MAYVTGVANHPELPVDIEVNEQPRIILEVNHFTEEVKYKCVNVRTFNVSPEEESLLEDKVYDDFYSIPKEVRNANGNDKVVVRYWSNERCSVECWLKWAE